jgi:hypothetical protein
MDTQLMLFSMSCIVAHHFRSRRPFVTIATQAAAVFIACACLGCGSGSPFKYVKASGKITYEDGTPLKNVRLLFDSQDAPAVEGARPRPAVANVNDQGEFDGVTSYKYGDGLIPGKHKVAIDSGGTENPVVPKEFQSLATTPLMVDTASLPLEIKVPKPKTKVK